VWSGRVGFGFGRTALRPVAAKMFGGMFDSLGDILGDFGGWLKQIICCLCCLIIMGPVFILIGANESRTE